MTQQPRSGTSTYPKQYSVTFDARQRATEEVCDDKGSVVVI